MLQKRKPEWLRRSPGSAEEAREVKRLLRANSLHTVCEEARCPNICECFKRKTATFLILGNICTRRCAFCSVNSGQPQYCDDDISAEIDGISEAVAALGLKHVVIT